jgi:hypothetical protein
MYVVIAEEFEEFVDPALNTVQTLEQAFAQIVCRCGYAYHFEPGNDCWRLVLTDVESPSHSPDPITSDFKKIADAKHDLMAQAVDGRLKGYIAMLAADFERRKAEVIAAIQ